MIQRKLKKQTLVSYEYNKDSPKGDRIVRNLKTPLLGGIDNLFSISPPNWQDCSGKLFWFLLWGTREPQLKGPCLVNQYLKKKFC